MKNKKINEFHNIFDSFQFTYKQIPTFQAKNFQIKFFSYFNKLFFFFLTNLQSFGNSFAYTSFFITNIQQILSNYFNF